MKLWMPATLAVALLLSGRSPVVPAGTAYARPAKQATPAKHAPPYRITAVRARLFYEHSGTFSEDVLASRDFSLWNVIIGEGSAKEPSTSTLILVEVRGQGGAYEPTRKVQVTATKPPARKGGKPRVVQHVVETGVLGGSGTFVAPLWIYDTGCDPVTVEARLLGQASSSRVRKTIDFRCGE